MRQGRQLHPVTDADNITMVDCALQLNYLAIILIFFTCIILFILVDTINHCRVLADFLYLHICLVKEKKVDILKLAHCFQANDGP